MEIIDGKAFDLPLVKHLGVLKSHSAQHTKNWHAHEGFELIFVLTGSTAWEFRNGLWIDINKNIHTVETLIRGIPADERHEVNAVLEAFSGNPRVIVGTGDQVGYETPEENLSAMIDAVKRTSSAPKLEKVAS